MVWSSWSAPVKGTPEHDWNYIKNNLNARETHENISYIEIFEEITSWTDTWQMTEMTSFVHKIYKILS